MPAGQFDEHVLQAGMPSREAGQRTAALRQALQECRHGRVRLRYLQTDAVALMPHAADRRQVAPILFRRRTVVGNAVHGKLDHVVAREARNQLARTAARDDPTLIDDRHLVAQLLGFFHVVRGRSTVRPRWR